VVAFAKYSLKDGCEQHDHHGDNERHDAPAVRAPGSIVSRFHNHPRVISGSLGSARVVKEVRAVSIDRDVFPADVGAH
jgi:hypothetical protein